ncbi:N-acetylmuramoyl-L-alanine amidase [Nocardia sputi]|uniref:N-acetylmuramoyl-L-alanine amidase n=1 Tax=Nocardia sputi TaxID=2943705 RepID=UPI0020BEBB2F|nr:N-acetylmuramoyl-L-alanine amidase [Nocardia sputi]
MPDHRPKKSYLLPVVVTLAVAAPFAALAPGDRSDHPATLRNHTATPVQLAEVGLAATAEVVVPVRDLTGLDLPDLRELPMPASIPLPIPLPLPPDISLPDQNAGAPSASGTVPGDPGPGSIADPTDNTPEAAPVPADQADRFGAPVREITRDEPFSMVALTAADLQATTAKIRARHADGSWGPWYDVEPGESRRRDHTPETKTGSMPVYVGHTNAIQILLTPPPGATEPIASAPAGPDQSPQPGPVAPPYAADPLQLSDISAVLMDPGHAPSDATLTATAIAAPHGTSPKVITRQQWGADESLRCEDPTYDDMLGGIVVHHTAGSNDYTREESAGIVRAIYTYHAQTLGWCDIGYNALVDKYGQVFEGRFGGLDRPVQGAHTGGFNENTSGIALMGNHESEAPTDAGIQALGTFIGWRARIAGLDPLGHTTMYSEGTEFTDYALGEAVELPVVFAHRDVGNTTCSGDAAYALMDRIRTIAADTHTPAPTNQAPNDSRYDTGTPPPDTTPQAESGLSTLAALTAHLLGMVDNNDIARHWSSEGGADGPLGAAISPPLPTRDGQQYVRFVHGHAYTAPGNHVYEITPPFLDHYLQLGGHNGPLGLPLSNAYPTPEGQRIDFQHGTLVHNDTGDIATTVGPR